MPRSKLSFTIRRRRARKPIVNGHTSIRILEVVCTAIVALKALLGLLEGIVDFLDNFNIARGVCPDPDEPIDLQPRG